MKNPVHFKQATVQFRDAHLGSFWPGGLLLVALGLSCALLPAALAVDPPPDGGYPYNNTAEGDDALFGLTTGFSNTAIGYTALLKNTTGNNNTAIGSGALGLNNGDNNTAT